MSRDASQKRRHAEATRAAMRQLAARRRCPACDRKAALRPVRDAAGFLIASVCRWCGHERPAPPR